MLARTALAGVLKRAMSTASAASEAGPVETAIRTKVRLQPANHLRAAV